VQHDFDEIVVVETGRRSEDDLERNLDPHFVGSVRRGGEGHPEHAAQNHHCLPNVVHSGLTAHKVFLGKGGKAFAVSFSNERASAEAPLN
jgi:hypothetical protein